MDNNKSRKGKNNCVNMVKRTRLIRFRDMESKSCFCLLFYCVALTYCDINVAMVGVEMAQAYIQLWEPSTSPHILPSLMVILNIIYIMKFSYYNFKKEIQNRNTFHAV